MCARLYGDRHLWCRGTRACDSGGSRITNPVMSVALCLRLPRWWRHVLWTTARHCGARRSAAAAAGADRGTVRWTRRRRCCPCRRSLAPSVTAACISLCSRHRGGGPGAGSSAGTGFDHGDVVRALRDSAQSRLGGGGGVVRIGETRTMGPTVRRMSHARSPRVPSGVVPLALGTLHPLLGALHHHHHHTTTTTPPPPHHHHHHFPPAHCTQR